MTAIPFPPKNPVTQRVIEYETLLQQARGGQEPPYAKYEFGGGGKRFMSNLNPFTPYEKPVSITGGVTTHLPDPELISTNP